MHASKLHPLTCHPIKCVIMMCYMTRIINYFALFLRTSREVEDNGASTSSFSASSNKKFKTNLESF